MSPRRPLFLTGASGFVGSELVRSATARGHRVVGLRRPDSPCEHLAGTGIRWVEGDLVDADALRRGIHLSGGREASVVHAAALISYRTGDRERAHRANVDGTRALLAACLDAGVQRLVHVSSVVTVGVAASADEELDETARFEPGRLEADYVATKRAAEELVLAAAGELDVVVVNPGAIFGPSNRASNTARLLAQLDRSPFPAPAAPGSLSVVGVGDVAEGILLALAKGRRGERYLLTESNWTMPQLIDRIYRALGRAKRGIALGPAAWRVLVGLAVLVDRLRPLEVTTPTALRLLGEHFRYDSGKARHELGWSPAPFGDVLDATVAWLRREGRLSRR